MVYGLGQVLNIMNPAGYSTTFVSSPSLPSLSSSSESRPGSAFRKFSIFSMFSPTESFKSKLKKNGIYTDKSLSGPHYFLSESGSTNKKKKKNAL